MDIHNIRQQLRTKSLRDIKLRVTFYARVSTDSDEQLNSLDNQVAYYENLIKSNPNWEYVPGYIDEGLSGISTKNREDFNRMIDDSKGNVFDLVLTKEISRFARNTLDSIQFTRHLLNNGVGVLFENDSICTFDDDSELRLSIMASIAQDELRKLSSRVKFGHQQAIKSGVVLGNSKIFGYMKEKGRLVIIEEEAEMIRELFTLYATDRYSMKQIEDLFWEKGYRNHNGNKIAHSTFSGIIANPKYKGYYVGNKVKVVDMFTKKQKFLPAEEWVMFKDETGHVVPAIVSEELWEQANEVLRRRSDDVKNRQGICNHANLLTGKLFCTHCGVAFYRRDSKDRAGNKNSHWLCSGKIKNGAESCNSFSIYESEIVPIIFEVFRETEVDVEALMETYISMYKELYSDKKISRQISDIKNKIELNEKKKSKLLEYNVSGKIDDDEFLIMRKRCNDEISKLQSELMELEDQAQSAKNMEERIAKIKSALDAAREDARNGIVTKEFVTKYIDKIFVTPISDDSVNLEIRIFTGDVLNKTFIKPNRRTSHTFLNITPVRIIKINRINRRKDSHIVTFTYNITIVA